MQIILRSLSFYSNRYFIPILKASYQCKHEILKFNDGELEDAVVCHCHENKCNYKVPTVVTTSTPVATSTPIATSTSTSAAVTYLYVEKYTRIIYPYLFITFKYLLL